MKIDDALTYLKDMLSGNISLGPRKWTMDHEKELTALLGRPSFIRLKHNPTEEAKNILNKNNAFFTENKEWIEYLNFVNSLTNEYIDERGFLRGDYLLRIYNGVFTPQTPTSEIEKLIKSFVFDLNQEELLEFLNFLLWLPIIEKNIGEKSQAIAVKLLSTVKFKSSEVNCFIEQCTTNTEQSKLD